MGELGRRQIDGPVSAPGRRPSPTRQALSRDDTDHPLLQLQSAAGNAAVAGLVSDLSVQRLDLTSRWDHIAKGEISNNGVIGYHWTGLGTDAVADKDGAATSGPDGRGVYKAKVRSRAEVKGKVLRKADESTFFPDDWGEARVKHAVEKAKERQNNLAEVWDVGQQDHGMMLFYNAKSAFPAEVEAGEDDDGSRKKKGGRGGGGRKK